MSEEILKKRLEKAIIKHRNRQRDIKARRIKGLHLLEKFPDIARSLGLDVEEMSVFYKIKGNQKGKAIYVSRKGSHVDLSGFVVDSPAFRAIPVDEIKRRHLGRAKARLSFEHPDDIVMSAYQQALKELKDNAEC